MSSSRAKGLIMLHMEQGRQIIGWICCVVVVLGIESVTDWLPACHTLWRMIPLERLIFLLPVKKFPVILCSLEDHHLVPNSLTLLYMPAQFIPLHSFPILYSFQSMLISSMWLRLCLKCSSPSGLLTKTLYAFFFSHVRATCPTQLTSLVVLCVNANRSLECGTSIPVGGEAPALLIGNPYLWQWLICRMNPALRQEFWTWPSTLL